MDREVARNAINYGCFLMEQATGVACQRELPASAVRSWSEFLFGVTAPPVRLPLESVWTLVQTSRHAPQPAYHAVREISLEADSEGALLLNPVQAVPDARASAARIGEMFVQAGGSDEDDIDGFYYLMQKYASTLPCTYGEDGVSLFQQWRLLAATMAAAPSSTPDSGPQHLAIVGLDLPGIQETVYTIAARSAGKSVRGRSAFVQLLVNAIVDRLVKDLALCRANVMVNAGGNALLLARWTDDLETRLKELEHEIDELLLFGNDARDFAGFQGDLSLALAWSQVPLSALRYPCATIDDEGQIVSEWQWYEKQVKMDLQGTKHRPFASLLANDSGFQRVFSADPIDSSRCCAVCRRPEKKAEVEFSPWDEEELDLSGQTRAVCPMCKSFVGLANDLAKRAVYLNRTVELPQSEPDVWQIGLHAVSGYWYSLDEAPVSNALCLALSPDGFPAQGVHGFWPLANATPIVQKGDVRAARDQGRADVKEGDIRDNSLLADASPGTYKRLGVLKADVDDLGQILVQGLTDRRSAALTAALSESLTLFFGGWLDRICREEPYRNNVYVLYAGGDDLLIIGSWHLMPLLAARLAQDFAQYAGHNRAVHLSAGISLVGGKEPLYAAMNAADSALKQAKRYPFIQRPSKSAICFLDRVFDWREFAEVMKWKEELADLVKQGAPKALLSMLLGIYAQYQDDLRPVQESASGYATRSVYGAYGDGQERTQLYLGPWLWQLVYRLRRLTGGPLTDDKIRDIQRALLQSQEEDRSGGVERLAVSARWAQLVSRKSDQENGEA